MISEYTFLSFTGGTYHILTYNTDTWSQVPTIQPEQTGTHGGIQRADIRSPNSNEDDIEYKEQFYDVMISGFP